MASTISHDPFRAAERQPKRKAAKAEEEPVFSKERLLRGGATETEADQLVTEYDAGSAEERASRDGQLAGISDGDVAAWLDGLRDAGHFGGKPKSAKAEKDAEVDAEDDKAKSGAGK